MPCSDCAGGSFKKAKAFFNSGQMLLSKMERVYYFDVPNRYADLAKKFPSIMPIKIFGEFFIEKEEVLAS